MESASSIAFCREGNGLRIMDLATRAVTNLTDGHDNFPLWSPRGDLIMVARLSGGTYDVYTIRPDGEYIAFASSRMGFEDEAAYTDAPQPYGEIFVMRFDGTASSNSRTTNGRTVHLGGREFRRARSREVVDSAIAQLSDARRTAVLCRDLMRRHEKAA